MDVTVDIHETPTARSKNSNHGLSVNRPNLQINLNQDANVLNLGTFIIITINLLKRLKLNFIVYLNCKVNLDDIQEDPDSGDQIREQSGRELQDPVELPPGIFNKIYSHYQLS